MCSQVAGSEAHDPCWLWGHQVFLPGLKPVEVSQAVVCYVWGLCSWPWYEEAKYFCFCGTARLTLQFQPVLEVTEDPRPRGLWVVVC